MDRFSQLQEGGVLTKQTGERERERERERETETETETERQRERCNVYIDHNFLFKGTPKWESMRTLKESFFFIAFSFVRLFVSGLS